MAGDWIKMRSDLFTHPKVVRISSALKADTLRTVGGLMSAWCLFDAHSEDGKLFGYTPATLDDHLRWPGFSAAMIAVKWLSAEEGEDGECLVLPQFDTHNGQSAKRRAQDADRKKESRKTSASDADKKRTREEKRREESLKASLSLDAGADADAGESVVLVTDGNGKPSPPLDEAQALGIGVPAAKRLRAIGIRVTALDPTLLALCAEKFTVEDMALMAAEQVLRKVHLWNDSEVHPELPELLASAATQQQMLLTADQYAAIQSAASEIGINYLATALRGRRQDAIDNQSPLRKASKRATGKPSASDNFEGRTYVGTTVEQLPPELRAAFGREQDGPG